MIFTKIHMKILNLTLLLLILFSQYSLWIGKNNIIDIFKMNYKIKIQKNKNNNLNKINTILSKEIFFLKKDLDLIEEYARNDLGMIKHKENFYVFIEKKNNFNIYRK